MDTKAFVTRQGLCTLTVKSQERSESSGVSPSLRDTRQIGKGTYVCIEKKHAPGSAIRTARRASIRRHTKFRPGIISVLNGEQSCRGTFSCISDCRSDIKYVECGSSVREIFALERM